MYNIYTINKEVISIIRVILREILDKQNRTVYWLSKHTGITNNNLAFMINNKTNGIKFDVLDKICEVLNCNVQDILEYVPINKQENT